MLINSSKQEGFTLTELLVALTISALLFTAVISIFVANMGHYRKAMNTNRLNEQLQATLQLMNSDILRAGYWANASSDLGTGQNNNPFMAPALDVSVNGTNDCILFSYDNNKDSALPAISANYDDERYGYRLSNQAIQARPPGNTFACNAAASAWENVTDINVIKITALTFTLTQKTITTGPATQGLTMRSIDITLSGQLTSDPTVTKTLTQHIRIRNDKFIP